MQFYQGLNRCGSFPLLSAPHYLFSFWTYLKRSEKIPGAPTWRWGEWIWLTGPSGLHRYSPRGLNISSIRVFTRSEIRKPKRVIYVHCCGAGSSMRGCHKASPGSIPGRDKFPGWGFFVFFSLACKTNARKLYPPPPTVPWISFGHYNHPYRIRLLTMNEWVNGVYSL